MSLLLARLDLADPPTLVERVAFWAMLAFGLMLVVKFVASRWCERDLRAIQPGVPVDEWRRRGLGVQPDVVGFQPGQRCPLCHSEHTPTGDAARCDLCGALFHRPCAQELAVGRCSTLGCAGGVRRVDAVQAPS